ncbi:NADH dehydrogenase (ubiquinone) complex I, assembly factor 6 [Hydra vulgaris]|nr:NADH dehydrogenase (ubiquinone) complex I, assembly factor 6-like [Hydra vulgaris]
MKFYIFRENKMLKTCARNLVHSTNNTRNKIEYCVMLVKTKEFENYLCTLLLPFNVRTTGMIIRAFNIELAQIDALTSDLKTAQMRIQFWRETLESIYAGRPPNHPVAISLALCLEKQMLSKASFNKLIDIREKHLSNKPFMSLDDAATYGEYSVSPILHLIMEGLETTAPNSFLSAKHLGKACSLVTLLRSVQYFTQRRIVLLPIELCYKYSLSQEDLLRNKYPEKTKNIYKEITNYALMHIDELHKLKKSLSKTEKLIFLPSISCEIFLNNFRDLNFDIFNKKLYRRQWILPWRLFVTTYFK